MITIKNHLLAQNHSDVPVLGTSESDVIGGHGCGHQTKCNYGYLTLLEARKFVNTVRVPIKLPALAHPQAYWEHRVVI